MLWSSPAERCCHADDPREVAEWYDAMAREVMHAMERADQAETIARDDGFRRGPDRR
jgi:hypothetical protein